MIQLRLILDGDEAWTDLEEAKAKGNLTFVSPNEFQICLLKRGMASGGHSVCIRVNLEDSKTFLIETSAAIFLAAADGIRGRIQYEKDQIGQN